MSYSDQEDILINELRFPKKNLLLVPVGPAHMDANFWNTRDGKHPLNQFWADRFLAFPNDSRSGPQREYNEESSKPRESQPRKVTDLGEPKFVSAGLTDTFMPYGIGERACRGRFFAKREIIAFFARTVNNFDI